MKMPLWVSLLLQLLCWGVGLIAIVFYTMRTIPVFHDFGIELSSAPMFVITTVDWFASFWFISVPLLIGMVIGVNIAVNSSIGSNSMRWLWTAVGCSVPFVIALAGFLTLQSVFISLQQQLS